VCVLLYTYRFLHVYKNMLSVTQTQYTADCITLLTANGRICAEGFVRSKYRLSVLCSRNIAYDWQRLCTPVKYSTLYPVACTKPPYVPKADILNACCKLIRSDKQRYSIPWYDIIVDHLRLVFDGPNILLKLQVDCVNILRDIVILYMAHLA